MSAVWINRIGLYRFSVTAFAMTTSLMFFGFNWELLSLFSMLGLILDLLVSIDQRIALYVSIACLAAVSFLAYFIVSFALMSDPVGCLPLDICVRTGYFDGLANNQVAQIDLLKVGSIDVLKVLSIMFFGFLLVLVMASRKSVSLPLLPVRRRNISLIAFLLVNFFATTIMVHIPNKLKDSTKILGISDVYFEYFILPGGLGYLCSLSVCLMLIVNSLDESAFYSVARN